MTIDEARELLKRYREGDTVCISSPEWADALDAALHETPWEERNATYRALQNWQSGEPTE